MKKVLLTCLILAITTSQGLSSFYEDKARGWFWYEDPADLEEKEQEEVSAQKANEYIAKVKKELEDKKALALVKPTHKNIYTYMQAQKQVMDRSELFSKKWQEVLYKNPYELDYTVKHPTMQAARHIAIDEEKKQREDRIKALSEEYGLFFFFAGSCSYCHGFAPIVEQFSKKYGWKVLAISLDGGAIKEYPNAQRDNGTAKVLNIKSLPTLIAVCPKTGKTILLSVGMTAFDQIEKRLDVLMQSGEI